MKIQKHNYKSKYLKGRIGWAGLSVSDSVHLFGPNSFKPLQPPPINVKKRKTKLITRLVGHDHDGVGNDGDSVCVGDYDVGGDHIL